MNYALVEKSQLDAKGIFPFAESLPDGRTILPMNYLKGVAGLTGVEIISGEGLKELKKQQEESYAPEQTSSDTVDDTVDETGNEAAPEETSNNPVIE